MFLQCQQDCGKLKNFNCFTHTYKGDFPKFDHKYFMQSSARGPHLGVQVS